MTLKLHAQTNFTEGVATFSFPLNESIAELFFLRANARANNAKMYRQLIR